MLKILFLIHDLGAGGAEKVLVNLVNNMNPENFEITVVSMFGGGVNEQFLNERIKKKSLFKHSIPGNSHIMKLFKPKLLHTLFIKDSYDIEVAFLEGPSARLISGCPQKNTKLVSWIHTELLSKETASRSFRSYREAKFCYGQFNRIITVSETVKDSFKKNMQVNVPISVLYNTNESELIREMSKHVLEIPFSKEEFKIIGVGKLAQIKGFDRLLRILKKLINENYSVHLYLLGAGPEEEALRSYAEKNNISDSVDFLGYKTNPYKYIKNSDLFVCSSWREGFSTAATEALIVGTPVCTTLVSGMKELLGSSNEFGIITENNDDALYKGIKQLLDNPKLLEHYRNQAIVRGNDFSKEKTVNAVEGMLQAL